MARNRRDRRRGSKAVVHVTNRTAVALPFTCTLLMEMLIQSALAKAQAKHRIHVCHLQWMGNHFHLILAGQAKLISPFMNILQGELGKYLKRLYPGVFQTKVFPRRFREQSLECPHSVLSKIVYIYANPAAAGLVNSITEWPGVTSFFMYRDCSHTVLAPYIAPRTLRRLPKRRAQRKSERRVVKQYRREATEINEFRITPDAWKYCFNESASWTKEFIYQNITNRLFAKEKALQEERERSGKGVIGAKQLKRAGINPTYKPKNTTSTPFLECKDPELRKEKIASYRLFDALCKRAWRLWKTGLLSTLSYPRGAYLPAMPLVQARLA